MNYMYWFRFLARRTGSKPGGSLFCDAAYVFERVARSVAGIDQDAVAAISHQPELNWRIHIAARCGQVLHGPWWFPFDDQNAALRQRIVREQNFGSQRIVDNFLQGSTACR